MQKMNFQFILSIIYLFGELRHILASQNFPPIQLDDDSAEKKKEVKFANKKISEQVMYRYHKEETARSEAANRISKFNTYTEAVFSKTHEPAPGGEAMKLWLKAKRAVNEHIKIKAAYNYEPFCYPPLSIYGCETVLEDPYFKKEKLTYDYSMSNSEGCLTVSYSVVLADKTIAATLPMEYKMCFALRENADESKSSVRVYLQSAFKQPIGLFAKYELFVLYTYIQNPETKKWERSSDPNISPNDRYYRYEALLSIRSSKLRPVS